MKIKRKKQPHGRWILKNNNKPLDLRTLPRCQATAKSTRQRCGNPAMKGKRVCYLHGGKSPGPPTGNKNAYRHGFYCADTVNERKEVRKLLKEIKNMIDAINEK